MAAKEELVASEAEKLNEFGYLLELACERTCECAAGFADKEYW